VLFAQHGIAGVLAPMAGPLAIQIVVVAWPGIERTGTPNRESMRTDPHASPLK
jgi:MFS transporter, putative metabolite:H+ symporter